MTRRPPSLPDHARVMEQCRAVAEFYDGEIDREHALNILVRTGMSFTDASEALDMIEARMMP